MQITILLAIAFAALCSGQATEFAKLPDCAKECAVGSLPKDCNLDVKCICGKQSFIHDIACCVSQKCAASDVEKSLQVAQQLCSTVSITVPAQIPNDCPGGSTAAAPASSASAATSAPASSGATSATTGTASAAAATASAASTSASPTPSNAASCNYLGNNIGALGAGIIAAVLL